MRSVPEWIGKTPEAKVPPRVKLRIWEREGGRCWITGRKIMAGEPWDLDHRIALINGGTHSESNLFPALRDKHREKTAEDVREKAQVYRKKARHIGTKTKGKGFPPPKRQGRASRPLERPLPPRRGLGAIFVETTAKGST